MGLLGKKTNARTPCSDLGWSCSAVSWVTLLLKERGCWQYAWRAWPAPESPTFVWGLVCPLSMVFKRYTSESLVPSSSFHSFLAFAFFSFTKWHLPPFVFLRTPSIIFGTFTPTNLMEFYIANLSFHCCPRQQYMWPKLASRGPPSSASHGTRITGVYYTQLMWLETTFIVKS